MDNKIKVLILILSGIGTVTLLFVPSIIFMFVHSIICTYSMLYYMILLTIILPFLSLFNIVFSLIVLLLYILLYLYVIE